MPFEYPQTTDLIPLKFNKIIQSRTYTMVVLGTEKKSFPIYAEPSLGQLLQLSLAKHQRPRPLTHDLLSSILQGLNVSIKQVVLIDLKESVYHARVYLEQKLNDKSHIVEVDARPSDSLTLALLNDVPIYCTPEVFNQAIAIQD